MLLSMRIAMTVDRVVIRVLGTALIILGLLFWTGNALALIPVHMLLGLALVLGLWTQAGLAARAGEQPGLVALAIAWGFVVPLLGLTQDALLPGPAHWLVKLLHLLVGLTAIGLAELLARRGLARVPAGSLRRTAQPAHGG
jgi:hypothetical protein